MTESKARWKNGTSELQTAQMAVDLANQIMGLSIKW